MTTPTATLTSAVINVRDLEQATEFWTDLLGVDVAREVPGFFVWLRPQTPGGVGIALQLVDHPKPGPNQVHVDLVVDDIAAATTRVVELGGSLIAEHDFDEFRWNIMGDPEGNEFCVGAHPS